jgi:hypothetical protein
MPSTDIDGSVIVILSETEARTIAHLLSTLSGYRPLSEIEHRIANKIARDLPVPKTGTIVPKNGT